MKKHSVALVLAGTGLVVTTASAHVGISSGAAVANTSQEITFTIGHGCEEGDTEIDTKKLVVDIPANVTNVRVVSSAFGTPAFTTDGGQIRTITWEKPTIEPADTNYYKFAIRAKLPNTPFTKLYFAAHQTCPKTGDPGNPHVVHWIGVPGQDAGGASAAAELTVMPARKPGWNKYTVPADIKDLGAFFKDAQIVWKGNAAYSDNENTKTQITGEPGVTALTELKANDEVWVRY